jgi:hypothetical protein
MNAMREGEKNTEGDSFLAEILKDADIKHPLNM